jgi:hypothetical protein
MCVTHGLFRDHLILATVGNILELEHLCIDQRTFEDLQNEEKMLTFQNLVAAKCPKLKRLDLYTWESAVRIPEYYYRSALFSHKGVNEFSLHVSTLNDDTTFNLIRNFPALQTLRLHYDEDEDGATYSIVSPTVEKSTC